ncbi:MAG: hypothetical protein ABI615_09340 [Chthoniobacterales bacterium]
MLHTYSHDGKIAEPEHDLSILGETPQVRIERSGQLEATLRVKGLREADNFSRPGKAPDHNETRNAVTAPVNSADASRIMVHVIRTDKELMITWSVCRVLRLGTA